MGQPCLVVCVAFVPGLSDYVILCVIVHMLDVEECACIMMYMYVLVCKHLFMQAL